MADLIDGKRPPMGAWGWVATGASVAVTLLAVVVLTRVGRRALQQAGVVAS
jgi:hypothetical protein